MGTTVIWNNNTNLEFQNNVKNVSEAIDLNNMEFSKIALIISFCSLIFITVIGNTLIVIAVVTTRRLRTVTNCFIMSLAVADWLVGAFVMPLAVVSHVIIGSWNFGSVLCGIWISSDVCLCTASILSLCAISIDRYLAITQPLNYSRRLRSKRLALLMILIVWLLAIAITCPPIFSWYDKHEHKSNVCTYNQNPYYVVFSAMGSFYVPLAVMLYVYAKISRVVAYRHNNLQVIISNNQKINHRTRLNNNQEESDCDRSEKISSESEETRTKLCRAGQNSSRISSINTQYKNSNVKIRESKTTKTLTIVVGGFIGCWLPFFIVYLANPFLPDNAIPNSLMVLLTWLGWVNSAVNPFIYAFCSPDFRCALWRITLGCCMTKQQRAKMIRNRTLRQSIYLKESLPTAQRITQKPKSNNSSCYR